MLTNILPIQSKQRKEASFDMNETAAITSAAASGLNLVSISDNSRKSPKMTAPAPNSGYFSTHTYRSNHAPTG